MKKQKLILPKATDRVFISLPFAGLCAMQVCVLPDATDKEILEVCNRDNPAGTRGGWATVINSLEQAKKLGIPAASSADGSSPAPGPCKECPGRLHKLVMC